MFELLVEPRTVTGKKVSNLRRQGYVPAVLYGRETAPMNLQCPAVDLERILKGAGVTSLINLQIGDGGEKRTALVRDVQYDVIRRTIQHADFYQVVMSEKITTEVDIVLTGTSLVETEGEGTVLQDMNTVEIQCLPGDLISTIEVDISSLAMPGDTLTVKDLQVPTLITILAEQDGLVAYVQAFRAEQVEETFEVGEVKVIGEEEAEEAPED